MGLFFPDGSVTLSERRSASPRRWFVTWQVAACERSPAKKCSTDRKEVLRIESNCRPLLRVRCLFIPVILHKYDFGQSCEGLGKVIAGHPLDCHLQDSGISSENFGRIGQDCISRSELRGGPESPVPPSTSGLVSSVRDSSSSSSGASASAHSSSCTNAPQASPDPCALIGVTRSSYEPRFIVNQKARKHYGGRRVFPRSIGNQRPAPPAKAGAAEGACRLRSVLSQVRTRPPPGHWCRAFFHGGANPDTSSS